MWIFFVLLFFTGEDGIKQSDGALHPIIIKHIKGAISAFEYCRGMLFCGMIHSPTPNFGDKDLQVEHFLLPALLLWNPWISHQAFVNKQTLTCPTCGGEMHQGGWNDGSSKSRQLQPRTIHCIDDEVLLVSAFYSCINEHYLLAHDEAVLKLIPDTVRVPFILFYKTGFTRKLADTCTSFCQRGLNFYTIESLLLELRWKKHTTKKQMFEHYKSLQHDSGAAFPDFKCTSSANTPSNNILTKCFLANFLEGEKNYMKMLQSLSVTSAISFDHTFKSAVNIGYLRQDAVWVPQYNSLFLVFNDLGQVITWQLTSGTAFSQVLMLLKDLQQRASHQKQVLRTVYVDDCCKLRSKIQSVFGNDVEVKLDIFHAVQRITRTIPKRHPLHKLCLEDLKLIFRAEGDTGIERRLPTPSPDTILEKLQKFLDKWVNAADEHGTNIITSITLNAIENLKKHITIGCLSGIPHGGGTNRNERFHSTLNNLVHRSRIGILLAYALISLLIHNHNNTSRVAGKLVITPADAAIQSTTMPLTPVGITPKCRTHDMGTDDWELDPSGTDIEYKDIIPIYLSSLAKLQLAKSLGKMKLNVLLRDIQYFSLSDVMQSASVSPTASTDIQAFLLERGLSLSTISKDGNCFFKAVATAISNDLTMWRATLSQYGIQQSESQVDIPSLSVKLRQLFVHHLLTEKRARYEPFFCKGSEEYSRQCRDFLNEGFYDNDIGDFMPMAFSAILKATIIVFDVTDPNNPKFFTPESNTDLSNPSIFLVYDPLPLASHYDVAIPICEVTSNPKSLTNLTKCKCGINRKDSQISCQKNPLYASRCKCMKQCKPCTKLCMCRNCGNPFGHCTTQHSRCRRPHKSQVAIPSAKRFAIERGEALSNAIWSDLETIVLQHIIEVNTSSNDVLKMYNDIVAYSSSVLCTTPIPPNAVLRKKSLPQIERKIVHLRATQIN